MSGGTNTLGTDIAAAMRQLAEGGPRAWPAKAIARSLILAAFGVQEKVAPNAGMLLTFDDGPDPEVTPAVLDLLARYDAKAVFFLVGNRIPRTPKLLVRILNEGHLIGNHTYRHPLDHVPSLFDYFRDVLECQRTIASRIGRRPWLFRPPLGSLTIGSLFAPRLAGLHTLLWSVDLKDWKLRRDDDAASSGEELAETARCGDIVLLHDDNRHVVALLKAALPRLCRKGIPMNRAIGQLGTAPR